MTCHQVQLDLSLYLYGELDFANEEAMELHLEACAFCQNALAREKAWHAELQSGHLDVPLTLLAQCRSELKQAIGGADQSRARFWHWPTWLANWGFVPSEWSVRIAFASFLVFVGFAAGRFGNWAGVKDGGSTEMSLIDPSTAHVRNVESEVGNRVRILVDQVHQREVVGDMDDAVVRQLLLAATRDPSDPGVRVDSVDLLKGQDGSDIRDALIFAVRHDPNAGVRLRAIDGLRRFATDPAAQQSLTYVLRHDEDSGVRTQAIDVLAPAAGSRLEISPELVLDLQEVMHSDQSDEYVRMRCLQVLTQMTPSQTIY